MDHIVRPFPRECGFFWHMRAEHGERTFMRYALTLLLLIVGTGAQAHPGHLAGLAGHDHWLAGAAIGLAGLIAIIGAAKGKKKEEADPEAEIEEIEEEGEPA